MLPPDPTERVLNRLPPLLNGYEAICVAIAQGDIDHAWAVAKRLRDNATTWTGQLRELYELNDKRRKRQ